MAHRIDTPVRERRRARRALSVGTAGGAVLLAGAAVGFKASPGAVNARGEAMPNPLAGAQLYVDPGNPARAQAQAWRRSRPADAAVLDRMANQPQAIWVGDWNGDVAGDVSRALGAAARAGAVPVLVAYNIPHRDCGSYSAGGAGGAAGYRSWIREVARGLAGRPAAFVLEPDAIAGMDCLPAAGQAERLELMRDATAVLKAAGAAVYVDAGHAHWIEAVEMADRLRRAGVAAADGFALNVSNYHPNAANIAYGERVSARIGGKHFVIDTSRNGLGSNGEWCNASGRALGTNPTTETWHPLVDAYLWIKRPGESDGTCAGGPQAGGWWAEYALGLVQRQTSGMALVSR
jgi:endoglucanase